MIVSTSDGRWHGIRPEAFEFRNDQRFIRLVAAFPHLPIQFSFQPGKWPDLNQELIRSSLSPPAIPEAHPNFGLLVRASDLKGMRVTNFRNESLGEIRDVTFTSETARIDYLLLSTGSWAGSNRRVLSVPPNLFMQHTDGKKLVLNTDKSRLKHAALFHDTDLKSAFWGANHEAIESATNSPPSIDHKN